MSNIECRNRRGGVRFECSTLALAQVFGFARGYAGDLCVGLAQVFRLAGVGGGWEMSESVIAHRIPESLLTLLSNRGRGY